MTGNIVGEEVLGYVGDQINFRQKLQGSGTDRFNNTTKRSNKVLNYLNTRNAWVKLASGIGIDPEAREKIKDILISDGYVGTGSPTETNPSTFTDADIDRFLGKNLAQNFILFNTFQSLNEDGTYKTRSGVIKNKSLFNSFNSLYGGMGFKDQGLQPIPGIIDVSVECVNRGSIKKATVTLKAYNKFQFSIIETLYLRLGYIMMLEYGWDKYVNNIDESTSPPTIDIQNTGTTIIDDVWFEQEKGKTPRDIISIIDIYRSRYRGNYDGFIGKVTNFEWKLNPDLSYDITINLITLGSVITSLAANPPGTTSKISLRSLRERLYIENFAFTETYTGQSINPAAVSGFETDRLLATNQAETAGEEGTLGEDVELPNLGADAITNYLVKTVENFSELEKNDKDYISFINFIPSKKLQEAFVESNKAPSGRKTFDETNREKFQDNFIQNVQNLQGRFYLRLGKFLTDFFKNISKFVVDPESSVLSPELIFEENEKIICNYEPNFIPIDPSICLFTPTFTDEVVTLLYPQDKKADAEVREAVQTARDSNVPGVSAAVDTVLDSVQYPDFVDNTQIATFFPRDQIEDFVNKNFTLDNNSGNDAGGTIIVGQLMNLYINVEFLIEQLESNQNTDGSISVFTFLQNICNGINRSMCGITNIEPSIKDNIYVNFIEQNLPRGYVGMLEAVKPKVEEEAPRLAEFELIGYNPTTGASNFVKDFNFITKITPDLQNIISIGAAATNSSTKGVSALPLNNWNKGLINRFQEEFEETTPPQLNTTAELRKREKEIRDVWIKKGKIKQIRYDGAYFSFNNGEGVKVENKPLGAFGYFSEIRTKYNNRYIVSSNLPDKYKSEFSTDSYRSTSGTDPGINAYLWDSSVGLRGYIISLYDLVESGTTVDGTPFNQKTGEVASDYISYLATAFGGRRTNAIQVGIKNVREIVPIEDAQWYKQNKDFIKLGKSLYKNFKEKVDKKQYQDEGVVTMTNGFIPLQFQMSVEGLAGVKIYNKLNIDQRFLPSNYPNSLSFITTKVNHKIGENTWTTDYECLSIPSSTATTSDKFKIFEDGLPAPTVSSVKTKVTPPQELQTVNNVRGPHSPDISTVNEYSPTGLVYFNEKTNKTQIVLHHTATDNIGRGSKAEVEAIMKFWRNEISPPNNPHPGVSTHWIADREGNGVKVMDYVYWARNSGVGDQAAKNQLSIELCSSGWLKKNDNGEYINSSGKIIKPENVGTPYKLIANESHFKGQEGTQLAANFLQYIGSLKFVPVSDYRGFSYFEEYTDDQIKLLKEILISMTKQFDAPIFQSLAYTTLNLQTKLTSGGRKTQVVDGWKDEWSRALLNNKLVTFSGKSHFDYRSPAVWCNFVANTWYNNLFPDESTSYSGGIGKGLFTHNTFSTIKSDIFPSKKLITALIEVGVEHIGSYDRGKNPYFNSFSKSGF